MIKTNKYVQSLVKKSAFAKTSFRIPTNTIRKDGNIKMEKIYSNMDSKDRRIQYKKLKTNNCKKIMKIMNF